MTLIRYIYHRVYIGLYILNCSPVYLTPMVVDTMLGEIVRDDAGNILGAKATTMTYIIKANGTIPREVILKYSRNDQF